MSRFMEYASKVHCAIQDSRMMAVCTYPAQSGFFSYRRTTHAGEPDYGRQVSAIVLAG